jgi:hypothetical protein
MTITVTAPNGSTVQFPDGTDHETISGVMAKFSGNAAPEPDKYKQAAIDEAKSNPAIDEQAGYTRRLIHGATLGADSTLAAAAFTPLEMMRHGTFDPREGYNYAKAREDRIMDKSRENTGLLGTAAEVLGGGISGAGLASGGVTAARFLAPEAGLAARSAASAVDAGGLGAFSGAMEGDGIKERFNNAMKGLGAGVALGGLTPGALKVAGAALSPVVSNIRARINPQGYAESQVARAIHESGVNPDEISLRAVQAANEGQPQFNMADAMGNAGQEMLGAAARGPGAGRTAIVDALENRQAGQGRRISGALAEGFNAPETATQTEARLTAQRGATADAEYGAVRNDANRVDVTPALNHLDEIIGTQPGQVLTPANDSVEAALTPFRQRLSRVNPDDFEAVQRIRGDMADAAQSARQSGHGNRARLISGAVRRLDSAMENASEGHLVANRNFAQASRNIEAVDAGRAAATRGRTEDTIPAFQALAPEGQAAFRSGYVDPLIAQTQGAAFGANKARPLINDAFQAEAGAMAPGNDMMQRRIAREQTMFETRNTALGGSPTAKNLAHDSAMGVDPHLIGQIFTGNWHGALRTALAAGHNAVTGNTPAVRQEVANILLQNGGNISPARLREMVQSTVARIQFVQNIARNVGRGAAGGLAVAAPGVQRRQ